MTPRSLLPALMLSSALFLAACESAEDKAEGYYQSALSLMEQGDTDRALLELRNVFQYDGFHLEARQLYADTLLDRGNTQEAYGQYLRLIEQYPDTLAVRQTLAEISIQRNDFDETERHGQAALRLAPEDPRSRAIAATLAYRDAALSQDDAALAEAVTAARGVLAEMPDNMIARRLVIAALLGGNTPTAALPEIELVLAQDPMLLEFQIAKFRLLASADREEEAGAQLEEMYELFPENVEVRTSLIAWYMRRGDTDSTEALLRDLAGDDTAAPEGHVTVVQFLEQTQGSEAATAELTRLIAANADTENLGLYRAMSAAIAFGNGDQEAAMTEMQDILDGAAPTDQTRRTKLILARMFIETGDQVGARALVEEVIEEDQSNVDALKMRAAWKIEEDDPDGAIADLRTALDQAPRDADVLTLMAQAHQRAGQPELAGERLALAVEVSDNAPDTSLRYARYLLADGLVQPAIVVLTNARRAAPTNLDIIRALSEIQLGQEDWGAVEELRQTLLAINTQDSVELANSLRAAALLRQDRTDEGLELIQETLTESNDPAAATVAIILTTWNAGRPDQARELLDAALAEDPTSAALRMLDATMRINSGDLEGAEAIYRAVAAEYPNAEAPVRLLFRLLNAQGRGEEAMDVLDAGLAVNPQAYDLLQIRASLLEQQGDIDGAIAIYEAQYAADSGDIAVANNLASLIATYRDDPAELERAYTIARRLRGIANPALQDTYGWLEYIQGNYEEALGSLEPAARALPTEPLVVFHLGMTYAALGRRDDAIETLTRAIELGEGRDLSQMTVAAETIATLQAEQ